MNTDVEMTLTELLARYPCTWDHPNLYPVWRCSLVCSVDVSRADYLAYDLRAEWHVED